MASRDAVEKLFALPFFEQIMPQLVQPMYAAIAQHVTDDEEEAARFLAGANEVNTKVYEGMIKLCKDFYVEVLTDEEVAVMVEVYQNPAFLKLMALMPTVMPRMIGWFEENGEELERLYDEAAGITEEDA